MTDRNICPLVCLALWLGIPAAFAAPADAEKLIALAREHPDSAELASAIRDAFPAAELAKGTAVAEQGPDFFFAVESPAEPQIVVDEDAAAPTAPLDSGRLHYYIASLTTSRTHNFHYVIDGASFGGKFNVIAYGPESYLRPGVKPGHLTEKRVHTSTIYPGMQSNYWIYTPAGYDPRTPAAVMIWQDGEAQVERDGPSRSLNVIDNLTAEKKIPVIVHIFISPGTMNGKRMRSVEYDTVSDRYVRFLLEEILPLAAREYNLRTDAYSRAIAGESSGGICAFNAAWFRPDAFSRVISRVGSFTSIQWEKEAPEGGNDYPFKVRREAKRNIRVWLQDGFNDLENQFGSWPLQNIEMANSLKYRGYDFHLSFSNNAHGRTPGFAEDAEELTWLWRDYDASETSEEFQMDPAEKNLPYYRVRLAERSPEK